MRRTNRTEEQTKRMIEKQWQVLKKRYGINTMEEFEKAFKNLPPLDISCMVSPLKTATEGGTR